MMAVKPVVYFSRLPDRRIIATLNSTRRTFAVNGDFFYQFIEDGVLDTMEINRRFNFDYIITDRIDGRTQYFTPGGRFRELILADYRGRQ